MKHLKQFNENLKREFTQDDFEDIRDVFQDLIDEHNIEPNNDDEFKSLSYNIIYIEDDMRRKHYHFPIKLSRRLSKYKEILIRIYLPLNVENRTFYQYEHQDKILKDSQDFNKRLNLMGYNSTIELNFLDTTGMRHATDIIQAITIHIPTTL